MYHGRITGNRMDILGLEGNLGFQRHTVTLRQKASKTETSASGTSLASGTNLSFGAVDPGCVAPTPT
jgi:hypothetical protein